MSLFRVLFTGSLLLLLCACGGGSSNSISGGEATLTGQFIDSAVAGIRYSTETRSGVTDKEGTFKYLEGETVNFYLGEMLLGNAHGGARVSLFDLVEGVTPVVGSALEKTLWESKQGPGFNTVINLATLLQTLDSDGDPENGIEISPDVAALFMPNSVDLNRHWTAFSNDQGFAQAMAEAQTLSLLDSARQTRKPWRALAHLYASIGVNSELRVKSAISRDTDGDGAPNYTTHYEFDTEGKLARQEYESSRAGTPDQITTYTYDTHGNPIRYEQDRDSDGLPDRIDSYAYDADGNLTGRETDFDGDGTLDDTVTYTYDANGNCIREARDSDGDGALDHISINTVDENGALVRTEEDSDGNGMPDLISTYTYDMNRARIEHDSDGDGAADDIETNTYGASGKLLSNEHDTDGDGTRDTVGTYSYDESGNLTGYEYDRDADGTPDTITAHTYDAKNNETLFTYDRDGDGTPDQIHTIVYDDDGYEIRREQDIDADGIPNRILTTTYDSSSDGWWSIFHSGPTQVTLPLIVFSPGGPDTIDDGGYNLVITGVTNGVVSTTPE